MGIVVIGAVFVDIKGFPEDVYVPEGRNAGRIEYIHGGVTRNVVEDIANVELRPTYVSIVDTSALGEDVVRKLKRHKVDTSYVKSIPVEWEHGWPYLTTRVIWQDLSHKDQTCIRFCILLRKMEMRSSLRQIP